MKWMICFLMSITAMGASAAGTHNRTFEKTQPQKQEVQNQEEGMSNTEKKAWGLGWEKDQRPFKPIKTQPERTKKPSSAQ